MNVLRKNRDRAVPVERDVSSQEFVEDDTQSIQVSSAVHLFSQRLFRGHVGNRSSHGAELRIAPGSNRNGDSKIGQLRDAPGSLLPDENVVRLQIAVNQSAVMGVCERLAKLLGQLQDLRDAELAGSGERDSGDEFHDDVGEPVIFASVVDRHDSRMIESGSGSRLMKQVRAGGRIEPLLNQDLDRDLTLQLEIIGPVHHSHATAPQLGVEAIPLPQAYLPA